MYHLKSADKYALMCLRLAAECRSVAAVVPGRDLKARYLRLARKWGELAEQSSASHVLH